MRHHLKIDAPTQTYTLIASFAMHLPLFTYLRQAAKSAQSAYLREVRLSRSAAM
jgi:hypothetical protein